MSEFARSLAVEQRKRLVGSLMDHIEKRVYPTLPEGERRALRDKVMQSVGSYHDFVLDCLKASVSDGMVVNDEALAVLQRVHDSQVALARRIDALRP